jgi:hypothetical protein
MKPAIVALIALASAGAAYAAADATRIVPVSTVFTNSKGDWVVSVWKDPDTHCQYLIRGDSITPRLEAGGTPKCS